MKLEQIKNCKDEYCTQFTFNLIKILKKEPIGWVDEILRNFYFSIVSVGLKPNLHTKIFSFANKSFFYTQPPLRL